MLVQRWHNHSRVGYTNIWGYEIFLDTLELVVLMLLMLSKVVLQPYTNTNNLSFVTFLIFFSGFDFVKNILLGLLGGFLHT